MSRSIFSRRQLRPVLVDGAVLGQLVELVQTYLGLLELVLGLEPLLVVWVTSTS